MTLSKSSLENQRAQRKKSIFDSLVHCRILKALLNELIDRSVEKKHPKLMLRRTESVVEKFLTNWLSICMYSHIKVSAVTPVQKRSHSGTVKSHF